MAPHTTVDYPQLKALNFNLLPPSKEYPDGSNINKIEELKREIGGLLGRLDDPLECMNMIDMLQRIGISYHFEEQIEAILKCQYWNHLSDSYDGHSLSDVALRFRLLRQHGYHVSSELFNKFKDREGRFKEELKKDIKGLLSLYEASQLSIQGEDILNEACNFATENLKASMVSMEPTVARQVKHALDHPLHKSLPRFESRQHIEMLRGGNESNRLLVELAVLDFNFVQSMHQRELQEISRWWASLGIEEELTFARIQPLKWFILPLAMLPEPEFSNFRVELAKALAFLFIVDDIYDVYGSLDELVLFTEAVDRWDLEAIKQLPKCMKLCFMALDKTTTEIGSKFLLEHGWDVLDNLRNTWAVLCKSFLVETKWFKLKHIPKPDEYLRNGMTSIGAHMVLVHAFFLIGKGITEETINIVNCNSGIISCTAMIVRLWDDLGTSADENQGGDDGSYIDYYMKEHSGCSIETAQEHLVNLITNEWKKLNKECLEPNPLPLSFTKAALNATRMVQVMFQSDDNRRLLNLESCIQLLIFESIPVS